MAARLVNAALGVWLLAAPGLLGYEGPARINHLIVGPLVASFAVMAYAEVLRELRWLNLVFGAWLVLSPLLLPHDHLALAAGVTTGMAITLLALVQGALKHNTGGGWPAAVRPDFHDRRNEPDDEERHQQGGEP